MPPVSGTLPSRRSRRNVAQSSATMPSSVATTSSKVYGFDLPAAVVDAEERAGEIVQRLLAAALLAQPRVDFQPDHLAGGVVVLAQLPAAVRLGPALGDDRVVGGVLHAAPLQARAVVGVGRRRPAPAHRAVPAADACPARAASTLPQYWVWPSYTHSRLSCIGTLKFGVPQVGRAAELAVPGVGELVRQQVAAPTPSSHSVK